LFFLERLFAPARAPDIMVRTNRHLVRIFLLLVLLMALFGAWLGSRWTIINPGSFQAPNIGSDGDWIDLVASLAEQVIQLFLGLTSGD
jgi:hypothetical protein